MNKNKIMLRMNYRYMHFILRDLLIIQKREIYAKNKLLLSMKMLKNFK